MQLIVNKIPHTLNLTNALATGVVVPTKRFWQASDFKPDMVYRRDYGFEKWEIFQFLGSECFIFASSSPQPINRTTNLESAFFSNLRENQVSVLENGQWSKLKTIERPKHFDYDFSVNGDFYYMNVEAALQRGILRVNTRTLERRDFTPGTIVRWTHNQTVYIGTISKVEEFSIWFLVLDNKTPRLLFSNVVDDFEILRDNNWYKEVPETA